MGASRADKYIYVIFSHFIFDMLLSILIPTCNRAEYLRAELGSLLPFVGKYNSEIEILVNDNASEDNTEKVVEEMSAKYSCNIDYKRQETNIGGDKNFKDVIARSCGKYFILLGDDDLMSPNFLDAIIPILRSDESYAWIHFNRLSGDANCSMNRLHDWHFDGMIQSLPYDKFVQRLMSSPNFISSNIIRRDVWDRGEANINQSSKYYGYEWFGRIMYGAIGETCLYYYMPLVIQRNPNKPWAKFWLQYQLGLSNLFRDFDKQIPGLYLIWCARYRKSHFYPHFYFAMYDIFMDREYYRNYRDEILGHCQSRSEKFIVNLFYNTPCPMLTNRLYNLIMKIYLISTRKAVFERAYEF